MDFNSTKLFVKPHKKKEPLSIRMRRGTHVLLDITAPTGMLRVRFDMIGSIRYGVARKLYSNDVEVLREWSCDALRSKQVDHYGNNGVLIREDCDIERDGSVSMPPGARTWVWNGCKGSLIDHVMEHGEAFLRCIQSK